MTAAVVEFVCILALWVTGWWLVPDARSPVWRPAAALPVGIAAYVLVELGLLATGLPVAFPFVALALVLTVGALVAARRGDLWSIRRRSPLAITVAATVILLTAVVPMVAVSADSFRYLTVARLLVVDGGTATTSPFLLQSRGLAVGALHGLSAPSLGYLRAVTPLVAISGLGVLWWIVRVATPRLDPALGRLVAWGAVALVATNHRYVFNAFYVNGHLLFAVWLLLLVGVAWLGARDEDLRGSDWAWAVSPAAAALVVLRPEGVLVAGLALVPIVVSASLPLAWRRAPVVAVGLVTVVWHVAVLVPLDLARDREPQDSVLALAALGVALLVLAALLPWLARILRTRLLWVAHAGAWLAVVVLAVRDRALFVDTAEATAANVVVTGAWGISLLLLAGLLVVGLARRRVECEGLLVFPLATFVPLSVLLAFLRGSAYRMGPGDSLNRMLLHVLPLAVLLLAVTADGEPRTWRWMRHGGVAGDGSGQDGRADVHQEVDP